MSSTEHRVVIKRTMNWFRTGDDNFMQLIMIVFC